MHSEHCLKCWPLRSVMYQASLIGGSKFIIMENTKLCNQSRKCQTGVIRSIEGDKRGLK